MFVIWLIAPSRGALFVQHVIFPTKEWWFFSTTLSYWCTYNDFLIPIFRKTTSNQEVWPSIRLFSISKYFEQGNGGIATVWVSRALLTTKQKRGIGIVWVFLCWIADRGRGCSSSHASLDCRKPHSVDTIPKLIKLIHDVTCSEWWPLELLLGYVIWQRLGSHPQRWPKKDVGTFPVRRMSSDRVAVLAACSHRRASAFARSSSARRLAAASLFISFSFACDLIRSTFTWWDFSSNQYSQPMFNLRFASWNPGHLKGVRL